MERSKNAWAAAYVELVKEMGRVPTHLEAKARFDLLWPGHSQFTGMIQEFSQEDLIAEMVLVASSANRRVK